MLNTLCACDGFKLAARLLLMLPQKSALTWKAIIAGHIDNGLERQAFYLFETMLEDNVQPDKHLYALVIKACGRLLDLNRGRAIHADAEEKGIDKDTFVISALIHMYGKCKSIAEAEIIFYESMMLGDTVVWNTMLSVYVEECEPGKALQLYLQMRQEGPQPNNRTFISAISACCLLGKVEETGALCLEIGEALLSDHRRMDLKSNAVLSNNLFRMYGICKCLTKAHNIFNDMMERNVVSWTLMLCAYLEVGDSEMTLLLYRQMQQERVKPDEKATVVALQACCSLAKKEQPVCVDGQMIKVTSLAIGEALHEDVSKNKFETDRFVISALISMYGTCATFMEAEYMFARNLQHNLVVFNAMLSVYVAQGEGERALHLFRQIKEEGMQPDKQTVAFAVQACCIIGEKETVLFWRATPTRLMALDIGRSLHGYALHRGFCSELFIVCSVLRMYKQCGSIVDAENLMSTLVIRHDSLWTEFLSLYVTAGEGVKALQVFGLMQEEGIRPNKWAYVMAIQSCSVLARKREISGYIGEEALTMILSIGQAICMDASKQGLSSDVFIISSLLTLYSLCGDLLGAEDVFAELTQSDIVTWNAMLSSYLEHNKIMKFFRLYRNLESERICQNAGTFVIALQACCLLAGNRGATSAQRGISNVAPLEIGRALHADARRKGFGSLPSVGSALILMYSNCGSMVDVEGMFHGHLQHDIVSWTALLSAYVEYGQVEKALQLFRYIQQEAISPDVRILVLALEACAGLADKEEHALRGENFCKETPLILSHALHADCLSMGFISDASVCSKIVQMYGKCMHLPEAENAFNKLRHHDILTWNSMLSTLIDHGQGEKALFLYKLLKDEGVPLNDFTALCVLQACNLLGDVQTCREVHFLIACEGWGYPDNLSCLLAYAYGSCGETADCQAIFDSIIEPDVAAWNAIIGGHARIGDHRKSMQVFKQMEFANAEIDRVTTFTVLSSCSHAGDVEGGLILLSSRFSNYDIILSTEHLNWLIDVLGRAGDFLKLKHLFSDELIQPSLPKWLNAFGACQNLGDVEIETWFFNQAIFLQPMHPKTYIALSNIYSRERFSCGLFMTEIL